LDERAVSTEGVTVADELPSFRSLVEVVQAVEERDETVYVRYSRGPESDAGRVSRDFEAGVDLPGLSVSVLTPAPWWPRPTVDWVARRLCKYLDLGQKRRHRPWLLIGDEVGVGTDHEPLVARPTPLGWVTDSAVAEARRHYAVAFDGDGLKGK
jgi:hypothetical protein